MSETTTTTTAGGAPSVVVEPGSHTAAGQAGTLRVHVRNLADGPRDMMITVIGLDDGWAPEPVRLDAVDADMTVSAEAALVPVTGAMAGEYPFVVVVQALVRGASAPTAAGGTRATTLVESTLTVDAPSEVLLAVEPADSRMRLRRRLNVVVSNTGTVPVEIALSTQTAKGLRLELPTEHLTVPARETVTLAARARNLRPQLTGHLDRRAFSVEARGLQAPARFRGTVTTRPLVTSTMIRVVALTMVVVLWGGGMLVGVPWLTQAINEDGEQTIAQEAGAGGAEDAAGADGSAGAEGEAGDGAGGAGGGAGDGAAAVDPGVRVGGVVTATDPSGVQVEIAPASIVADADGGEGIETDASGESQAMGAGVSGAGGGGGGSFARSASVPTTVRSGLARDTDDEPLGKTSARALVLESTTALATSRSTSTDTDGTWAFVGLSPNINYLVTISKPGYQTVRHVVSGAEAAAGGVDVELVAGDGRLTGQVTGPGGVGQGGVDIVITDGTSTITTSTTTTGVVGSWSVDGLSTPSTYLVTASGTGLGAQSTLVTLAAGGTRTTNIALSQGVATLSGMVSGPDSLGFVAGLGGATVTASDGDVTRTASTVTGGLPGSFTLVDLPIPGRYTVTVEAPGFAPQTQEIDLTAGSSAAVLDVLLTSGSGVVQGTVRDPAGAGLSAAGLTLRNDEHVYKTMATSDGSGSFRFNGIAPGDYVLSAEQFGHLTGYTTVTVGPGAATTADLVLTVVEGDGLVSTSRIRGRVSDARTNGQLTCTGLAPGERCLVTVSLTAQNVDGSQRPVSVTSDPNLEYLVPGAAEEGLLPGIYTLTVSAPGYEPGTVKVRVAMDQTVTAGQVALFPKPALTGTVLTRVGAVPVGTCVVAVPRGTTVTTDPCTVDGAAGATPPSCTITAPARCAYTGDNGSYSMINLTSGTYQLTVRPGSAEYRYTQAPTEITLAPGDVRRFDATIDRLGRVAVTVLADLGHGTLTNAAKAIVTPRLVGGDGTEVVPPEATADDSGYVQLTHLPAGEYVLDVSWVSSTNATYTGQVVGMIVADNQERSVPVVLTGATRDFTGRLVTQLKASGAESAGVHTVEVSGVVGYNGLSAIRRTVSVTTGADGVFRVFATAPAAGLQPGDVILPLVADQVDVVVPAAPGSGYLALNRSNIAIVDNTQIILEMQPAGQTFRGTVELVGAGSAPGALFEDVTFEVLSAPPGAGTVSLAAGAPTGSTATVVWTDLAQTADGTGTLARPGEYRIRASLPGYDPVERTVVVNVGSSNTPTQFVLRKYGELRVNVLRSRVNGVEECQGATPATTCVPVPGPIVTLSINGMSQVGQAEPGTSFVDFGAVPSGDYTVVVQANGYERRELSVPVNAGDTRTTNVHNVALARLGVITGTVTTGSGGSLRALPGVAVTARSDGTTFSATTGADGTYRITGTILDPGLRDGDWVVTAALAGYQGGAAVTVPVAGGNDGTASFTMTADPVTVTIWVIDPVDNTGVDGLTVQLFNGAVSVPPTCVPGQVGAACTEAAGSGKYTFQGVPPVQTTVQISGAGFRPLTVTVTPPPGQSSVITVPITSIANTISGTVTGQTGAGSTSELEGAVVGLTAPGFTSRSLTTPATGAFVFAELPDGTYVLQVTRTGYGTTARTLTVAGGQVYSIDVTLFESSRQVVVTLTSTSGYDLTGTLVSLAAGPTTLSAQPLARSTGSTYTTTFNQVPPGAWTATFSGAAGHPWSFTSPLGDDETTLAESVAEVRVQLSATSSATGAPGSLAVSITGGPSPAGTRQLVVDGPSETLYLRQVPTGTPAPAPYVVTAAPTGGWAVAPTARTITRTETDVWAQFVLTGVATTTTLTTPPAAVTVGVPQTYAARVTGASAGTVTFTLGGVTLGTGTVAPNGNASVSATLVDGQPPLGSQPLVATYDGSGASAPSVSTSAPVLVQAATTVTMTTPDVVELPAQPELSATVTPMTPGTVTFRRATTVLCTATTDGSTPATCTATGLAEGTHSVRATFDPTDPNYLSSTSAAVNAVVSPAPGP